MSAQSMEALAKANEIRSARAALKREVKAGRVSITEALHHPAAAGIPVGELLRQQRGWGGDRVRRALRIFLPVPASRAALRPVGWLSEARLDELARVATSIEPAKGGFMDAEIGRRFQPKLPPNQVQSNKKSAPAPLTTAGGEPHLNQTGGMAG